MLSLGFVLEFSVFLVILIFLLWTLCFYNQIWKVEKGPDGKAIVEFLSNLARHTKAVNVVRFAPGGEILASGGDGMCKIGIEILILSFLTFSKKISVFILYTAFIPFYKGMRVQWLSS